MILFDEADLNFDLFGYSTQQLKNNITKSTMQISTTKKSQDFGLEKGQYTIFSCDDLPEISMQQKDSLVLNIKKTLSSYLSFLKIKECSTILVCGIGNKNIAADSLGTSVCNKVLSCNTCLSGGYKICVVLPQSAAQSGIETYNFVLTMAKEVGASCIILIDSLQTKNSARLAKCFQLSTTGLVAGGANFNNKKICKKSTNIACISVGVPLLFESDGQLFCSAKIDKNLKVCNNILSMAINLSLNKNLNKTDIQNLLLLL